MKVIYWDNPHFPEKEIAASMGFFDGVHRGHRFLIEQLKELAKEKKLPTALITFSEHPRKVLQKEYQPCLLTTTEEKLEQLSRLGIDYCIIIPFTKEFSQTTAKEFIQNFLCKQLHVKLFLVGYDHKFGKDRTDDFDCFLQYGKYCDMEVIKAGIFEENNNKYSSTRIRNYLEEGDVKKASELLSYNYSIEGIVNEGNRIGRSIGFPTANIHVSEKNKLIPKEGVYAVYATIDSEKHPAMLYIGNRPTLSSNGEKRIEAHIFNFNEDIYTKNIRIEFVDFIREDMQFNGLDELKKQLSEDRINTQERLSFDNK